jgi:outer membrane protein assembly factor BamB
MTRRSWWLTLGLAGMAASSAAAQRVAETALPLADSDARHFYFVGDRMVYAVAYNGGGKVDARINAYDLAQPAFAWRQQVRVQESDQAPGGWVTTDEKRNRLYLGNGPLTVLDALTGQTVWSLDCNTAGSLNLRRAQFHPDGHLLIQGTAGCGEADKRRLLRVDDATGKVIWRFDAEVHDYKVGQTEHRDFASYGEGQTVDAALLQALGEELGAEGAEGADSAAGGDAADGAAASLLAAIAVPERIVIAGKRLQAVNYATGQLQWSVKEEPGRWMPLALTGLSLWVKDHQLTAYSTVDGTRAWAVPVNGPTGFLYRADHTPATDVIVVSYRSAHRISQSGREVWSLRRPDEGWGQGFVPPLLVLHVAKRTWSGVDLATGAVRWTVKEESGGDFSGVDEDLSVERTGVVLIRQYDRRSGPFILNAIDAASGRLLWRLERLSGEKVSRYRILDGARLVVDPEKGQAVELDLKSGAVVGPYHGSMGASSDRVTQFLLRYHPLPVDGYRLDYSLSTKTLTCTGPDGKVVWTRKGELAEDAAVEILPQRAVVWVTRNGTVELIDLASGTSLHTTKGNQKPRIGLDPAGGRVLVPEGKTLKVLTVAPASRVQ